MGRSVTPIIVSRIVPLNGTGGTRIDDFGQVKVITLLATTQNQLDGARATSKASAEAQCVSIVGRPNPTFEQGSTNSSNILLRPIPSPRIDLFYSHAILRVATQRNEEGLTLFHQGLGPEAERLPAPLTFWRWPVESIILNRSVKLNLCKLERGG